MKKIYGVFFVTLLSFLLSYTASSAIDCWPSSPWFSLEPTFDYSNLPKEIKINKIENINGKQGDPLYVLINTSDTPFYILTVPKETISNPIDVVLPAQYSEYRVHYFVTKNETAFSQSNGYFKNPLFYGGQDLDESVYQFSGGARNVHEGVRPANVIVPESQDFKIIGYFQGKVVEIKGLMSYGINKNYTPAGCSGGNTITQTRYFYLLIALIVCIVLMVLIFKSRKNNQ